MKDSHKTYIKSFSLQGLWGYKEVEWTTINSDVNVLVGINGSGKTTLMDIMYAYYTNDAKELKKYQYQDIQSTPLSTEVYPLVYLRTFDTPLANKRKSGSPLMEELNNVVFQNKEGISFFNYRMKMLDFRDKANEIQQNIDELFGIINELFQDTGKTISISKGNNSTLTYGKLSVFILRRMPFPFSANSLLLHCRGIGSSKRLKEKSSLNPRFLIVRRCRKLV